MEGSGSARCGGRTLTWQPHDIFVIPSWSFLELDCTEETVLFSYSDRIVQEKLDFFREERVIA